MTIRQAIAWEERQQGGLPATNAPVNTSAPVISGDATVGQLLSCTTGTWSVTPDTYNYQWYRGINAIGAAVNNTYTLVDADFAANVKCKVTANSLVTADSNTLAIGADARGLNFSKTYNSQYLSLIF